MGAKGNEVDEESGPRSFAVFIQQLADGDCHTELGVAFQRLTRELQGQAHAQAKGVKGSITLRLNVLADDNDILDVSYVIETKEPKPRRARSTFWLDKRGNITRENPKQLENGLRDVSKKQTPKEAPAPAAAREV